MQGIGETGVGGLKRQKRDTWVTERSYQLEAVHPPGAKEEVGAAERQKLDRGGTLGAGSQASEEGARLAWCWTCGEKTEAGERNHWGATHETKQISWWQRGVGSSCWGTELRGQGAVKRCCRPYTATPTSPSKASQASLPFPPS